ncbi:MAG: class I SAM-dependent methyltransferase [Flavobacteriales bacterium]|nr:class I SAM-dependent methyltransferase [Flavobacteriales bacterium]
MRPEEQALEARFHEALKKDRSHAPEWMTRWDYQVGLKKRKRTYEDGVVSDFFKFGGAEDLLKWMSWFRTDYPDYINDVRVEALVKASRANDERITGSLGLDLDGSIYDRRVGLNNAHDHLLPQSYPVPERARIRTVLDFGAGYGRQANLWATQDADLCYIGMDAIVNSYCLQHLYYKGLGVPFVDYIDAPDTYRFERRGGIQHIPTWRSDLIPDGSVDLVMCVQVLPELNSRLVRHMVDEFKRVLKPGGALYIRDHAYTWKPTDNFDVEAHLGANDFDLEFRAHIINDVEIHGIPRIWRKALPEVIASRTRTWKQKLEQAVVDVDTLTGGGFKRTLKKLKGKA